MDDVLSSAPLFAALDAEASAALRTSMETTTVAKGDVLFHEGQLGDRMYIITDGKVKLGTPPLTAARASWPSWGPGAPRRAVAVRPGPRTATAIALTDLTALGLGHAALRPWLTGRPEVAESLLQALAQRLRRTNEALADLVFSDVPGRVAKALLELGDKFGQQMPDGVHVTHDMTQEELAQLVGASRETVNKALSEFATRGWIKLESRSVVIIDSERLARRSR